MNVKTFRPISSNRDLVEALEDGFARLTGEFVETSSPKVVSINYAADFFGDGEVVSAMHVSRTLARKLGLNV
jgi:hypothetical protein